MTMGRKSDLLLMFSSSTSHSSSRWVSSYIAHLTYLYEFV